MLAKAVSKKLKLVDLLMLAVFPYEAQIITLRAVKTGPLSYQLTVKQPWFIHNAHAQTRNKLLASQFAQFK